MQFPHIFPVPNTNIKKNHDRLSAILSGRAIWFYIVFILAVFALAVIPGFILYDAAMVELHIKDHSDEPTKRILFMGWASSLTKLNYNWVFVKELEELCLIYDPTRPRSHGYHEGHEGGAQLYIFYREEDEYARHELQAMFVQAGCAATFIQEETSNVIDNSIEANQEMNILAMTRSKQRQLVMEDGIHYDVVINMDLDHIISLPPLSSIQHGLTHLRENQEDILCANEHQTWRLLIRQALRLHQKHKKETGNTQGRPSSGNSEHCSEGFAMYGWKAWESPKCDFYASDSNGDSISSSNTAQLERVDQNLDQVGQRQLPPLRGSSHERKVSISQQFQECIKTNNDNTWIGVQPKLVIWRKTSSFPWLLVMATTFVLAAMIRWPDASPFSNHIRKPKTMKDTGAYSPFHYYVDWAGKKR